MRALASFCSDEPTVCCSCRACLLPCSSYRQRMSLWNQGRVETHLHWTRMMTRRQKQSPTWRLASCGHGFSCEPWPTSGAGLLSQMCCQGCGLSFLGCWRLRCWHSPTGVVLCIIQCRSCMHLTACLHIAELVCSSVHGAVAEAAGPSTRACPLMLMY